MLFFKQPFFLPVAGNRRLKIIALVITCAVISSLTKHAAAEQQTSTRIEVFSLSQNYWDTQYGDTLGEIVRHLLPNNPAKHEALKQDIVRLNPEVFIASDPEQLIANKRLWMPGYMKQADSKVNPTTTTVERYSWGNIKRQK